VDFFYAHWEIKGGLYQNLPINATEILQLAYACDRTWLNMMHVFLCIMSFYLFSYVFYVCFKSYPQAHVLKKDY